MIYRFQNGKGTQVAYDCGSSHKCWSLCSDIDHLRPFKWTAELLSFLALFALNQLQNCSISSYIDDLFLGRTSYIDTLFFRESSLWEYSPKQGPAHIVLHVHRVLNLVIIWIWGYFWDAHMQLGSIPTSCHPKPRLSTPEDLVKFTFILCQKEESLQNGKSENIIAYL